MAGKQFRPGLIVFITILLCLAEVSTDVSKSSSKSSLAGTTPASDKSNSLVMEKLTNITFITVIHPPFVYPSLSDGRYSGFFMDVLHELSTRLGYNVQHVIAKKWNWGQKVSPTEWNEMISAIEQKKADVGIAAHIASSDKADKVYFSQPVLRAGLRIVYRMPEATNPPMTLVTMVQPFTPGLWVLLVCMLALFSLGLYLISRFSPYEDIAFFGTPATYEGLTLANSFLYTFSSLVRQGYTSAPKSISGRVLVAVWWVFTVFTVSAYIAGLTVILFKVNPKAHNLPFTTMEEAAKQTDVQLLVVRNSNAYNYLKKSQGRIEKMIVNRINASQKTSIAETFQEALHKLKDKDSSTKFALITEAPYAEYWATRKPCDLIAIGEPLGDQSYSFACRNDTLICHQMNPEILEMVHSGRIRNLQEKWNAFTGCTKQNERGYTFHGLPFFEEHEDEDPDHLYALTINIRRFGTAFIMLAIGMLLSLACLALEICYFRRQGTAQPKRMPVSLEHTDN